MNVLVTGAGRGIGLEFTKQLLNAKKNVIAWVRDPQAAKELQELQKKYSSALTIQKVDVTSDSSVKEAATQVKAVDVVINNAGTYLDSTFKFTNLPMDAVKQTMEVNVYAPIRVAQNLLPQLEKSNSALLVNISSRMGSIEDNTSGGAYAYRMSKTAVNMFTKSFSVDYPKIKTFCMHPGWVQTEMGGSGATTTTEQSVTGLLRTILEPQKHNSGSFINFEGNILPW